MDLTVTYDDIRDEVVLERDGTGSRVKTIRFRIGKYGPFTERVANVDGWQQEFNQRVDALKRNLQSLPS